MLRRIYQSLPTRFQPYARKLYHELLYTTGVRTRPSQIEQQIQSRFFPSSERYIEIKSELEQPPVSEWLASASDRTATRLGQTEIGNRELGEMYYVLIRELQPDVVVETGVRHGFSSLFILAALSKNESGHLYSVDLPLRPTDSVDEFQDRTHPENPATTIPEDAQSGWIIPDELRERWTLKEGKSQRVLPLVLEEVSAVDFFTHDSEHSLPCMMFEFELGWEYLNDGGILASDDINQNEAFELFKSHRAPSATSGTLTYGSGYIRKDS